MPELLWTARFDADVAEVYDWLSERNEIAADNFYRRLLADLEQLVDRPWSGKRVRDSSARVLAVVGRRYLVVHMVELRGVILDTLFDQRRDPRILAARIRRITGGLPDPNPPT
jgi:plasmid stabilization system protein ParE